MPWQTARRKRSRLSACSGSLGWVCAAVFAFGAKFLFDAVIDGTAVPLACGAAVAAVAAVFALFLPATPPKAKGEPMSVADALGLRAFAMLKDRNVAIFMVCVIVWTVAFTIYWMYGSFLASLGVKNITPTLNVGQVSELLFMVLIPVAIKCIGFKNTMGLGILAMFLRYVMSAFAPEVGGLYWGAIAVHGIIFGFFFVAAQMYIDKKASDDHQGSGAGLVLLLLRHRADFRHVLLDMADFALHKQRNRRRRRSGEHKLAVDFLG